MTAFTLNTASGNKYIGDLTPKTGGDTYSINNGTTLTIDQDSRYGVNASTLAGMGSITVAATGGVCLFDGRYVRLIPFNSGSGNVPAGGTEISQGAVTGKLIGVWSAINVAPTTAGEAMPASGFIKVNQVSQVPGYSAGALTGISANATGQDVAGWIEVVGSETSSLISYRLGKLEFRGDWYQIGDTTGDTATIYQVPTSGRLCYLPGVFVSKTSTPTGDEDYEFYPNCISIVGANLVGTDELRGRVCWLATNGTLRLGSDGTNTNGFCPPAGRKIVIGNIFLANCTTADRTENALPHATLTSRYEFSTTNGGEVFMDKTTCAWYVSLNRASKVKLQNSCIYSQLYLEMIGSRFTLTRFGVAPRTTQNATAGQFYNIVLGGDAVDCTFAVVGGGGGYPVDIQNSADIVLTRPRCIYAGLYSPVYTIGGIAVTRGTNITVLNPILGTAYISLNYAINFYAKDVVFYSRQGDAAAQSTAAILAVYSGCDGVLFDGLQVPVSTAVVAGRVGTVRVYSPKNIEYRNLGTRENPIDMGNTNQTFIDIYTEAGGKVTIRRCYYINCRSYGVITCTNQNDLKVDNLHWVGGTYDALRTSGSLNTRIRGCRHPVISPLIGTLTYGTHWQDGYTSDTAGKIQLLFNEPSEETWPYFTASEGVAFDGTAGLRMPTVGMSLIAEMDYFSLGHTGFSSTAPVFSSNFTAEYQIDTGSGWNGTWLALNTTNLMAETVSSTVGFKLKFRFTTSTANTVASSGCTVYTTTTAEAQQVLYPLGNISIDFIGVHAGTEIRIFNESNVEVAGVENCVDNPNLTWSASSDGLFTIRIISVEYGLEEFTYTATIGNHSIPIQQEIDPWFKDPI